MPCGGGLRDQKERKRRRPRIAEGFHIDTVRCFECDEFIYLSPSQSCERRDLTSFFYGCYELVLFQRFLATGSHFAETYG